MTFVGVGLILVLIAAVVGLNLHRHSTAAQALTSSLAPAVVPTNEAGPGASGGSPPTTEAPVSGHPLLNLLSDAISDVPSTDLRSVDRAEIQAPTASFLDRGGTNLRPELRMADGNPRTAWQMDGSGQGSQITVTFGNDRTVAQVGLINGDAGGHYSADRRILEVQWSFGGHGSPVTQTLRDGDPNMQYIAVPPVSTRTVVLTLLRVSDPGTAGNDYTAISELRLSGWVG